jgi:cupin superfamily acireductone dioxygenase involved in methionine salvage
MTFVVNNFGKFQTNNSVYMISTRRNDHLHIPITHLSSYQRGVYYSGVKLFKTMPSNISALKNDKNPTGKELGQ